MLFIDKDEPTIVTARNLHLRKVKCRIRKKLFKEKCGVKGCEICDVKTHKINGIPDWLLAIFSDDVFLDDVIAGLPDQLMNRCETIWAALPGQFGWEEYNNFLKAKNADIPNPEEEILVAKYKDTYELLRKIFDYDTWFKNGNDDPRYDAYELAANLNRSTCTYCNRLYTHTMKKADGKKIMRPTFDHWFSHGRHPLLGLSFYNLIPSCTICNSSVKGFKQYLISSHLHPYIDKDCCDQISFDYTFDDDIQKYVIHLVPKGGADRASKSYEDLMLKEIYSSHQSELGDLIKIKDAYSEGYIKNMMNAYKDARLSHSEVYRLAFGVELEANDFHKRPLSKFTKDILSKLKMI